MDMRLIDENLRELVMALNSIPGIETFSSCGGHENPKQGQFPKGMWMIFLQIEHNRRGWKAMDIISECIWMGRGDEGVIKLCTDYSGCELAFTLEGYESDTKELGITIMKLSNELANNRKEKEIFKEKAADKKRKQTVMLY